MKTFAEKAYTTSKLDAEYTEQQIKRMLEDVGIHSIRTTNVKDDFSIEFLINLRNGENSRKVRIDLPFPTELKDTIKKQEQRKRTLFRVLFYHLKDKFVAVSNGLKEFEEEFLADLIIIHNGKEMRLGDVIVPQYKQQLKTSKVAILSIKS